MTAWEPAQADPAELRALIRDGRWQTTTTGACAGRLQANLVIVPAAVADDFRTACGRNPQALPLLEMTAPGDPTVPRTAPGADLRTDLPRYHVHRDGALAAEVSDLHDVWRDDLVAFLLGCSFSAEEALLAAGVRLRHLDQRQGVPMFVTNVDCAPAGPFHGPLVVSMRPIATQQVERAVEVTQALPLAHGAPVHAGDPAELGIADVLAPAWGDPIEVHADETPVFWACGVTPQTLLQAARLPLAITHAPGYMFVTDIRVSDITGRTQLPSHTGG